MILLEAKMTSQCNVNIMRLFIINWRDSFSGLILANNAFKRIKSIIIIVDMRLRRIRITWAEIGRSSWVNLIKLLFVRSHFIQLHLYFKLSSSLQRLNMLLLLPYFFFCWFLSLKQHFFRSSIVYFLLFFPLFSLLLFLLFSVFFFLLFSLFVFLLFYLLCLCFIIFLLNSIPLFIYFHMIILFINNLMFVNSLQFRFNFLLVLQLYLMISQLIRLL